MKRLALFFTALIIILAVSTLFASASDVFEDVSQDDWFYNYVCEAYNFGFINGRTQSTFCPYENLTIAEAFKLADMLFINIMKLDVSLQNGNPWYTEYIEFASKYNILDNEYSDYNKPITRREFVHIFYNAIPPQNLFEYLEFQDGCIPDVADDDPYYSQIYSFYRSGILTGKDSQHRFYPDDCILRSEVCAVLMRIFYMNSFEIEFDNSSSSDFVPITPPPFEYINFDLYKDFSDVILPLTEPADDTYIEDTVFIGDSLSVGLKVFQFVPENRVLAAGSIDPHHAINDALIMLPDGKKVTIPQACGYYLPKRAVITLGTNSVSWRKPQNFIQLYSTLIDTILSYSPDTEIIVQSIPPVSEAYELKGSKITNKLINSFNEHLADMCRQKNLPFLNTAEALKNDRGYLADQYQSGDGLHHNRSAYKIWIDYLKTHSTANN